MIFRKGSPAASSDRGLCTGWESTCCRPRRWRAVWGRISMGCASCFWCTGRKRGGRESTYGRPHQTGFQFGAPTAHAGTHDDAKTIAALRTSFHLARTTVRVAEGKACRTGKHVQVAKTPRAQSATFDGAFTAALIHFENACDAVCTTYTATESLSRIFSVHTGTRQAHSAGRVDCRLTLVRSRCVTRSPGTLAKPEPI